MPGWRETLGGIQILKWLFQIHNSDNLAQQDANNEHFHLNNSVMMDESHSEKILYKKWIIILNKLLFPYLKGITISKIFSFESKAKLVFSSS